MNKDHINNLAQAVWPQAVAARRHLHQHPELSYNETDTAGFIAGELSSMGYAPQTGLGGHGVKAVLWGGGGAGRTVALRADIDALPIQEATGLPFASSRAGVMHACGHDVHTATLLGAARALIAWQPRLRGNIVFIFQPAEESPPGGAMQMIRAGVLENPTVDAIFALHIWPGLEAGKMSFASGPMMAAPDQFEITITGRGGHAARPHETVDAVYIGAQLIVALQGIVSRAVDPFRPAVLTVGALQAGSKHNIVAHEARLMGTVRTMHAQVRDLMRTRLHEVTAGICAAYGAQADIKFDTGYPVLINDERLTAAAKSAAEVAIGADSVEKMEPTMGAEDFAFYLQKVPGSFARLGSAPSDLPPDRRPGLHSAHLIVDEACIATGIAYYLSLVQKLLLQ